MSVTVTALDQYGNQATTYAGTVHLSSSDPKAVLPGNSTLVNGAGTFTGVILETAGTQSVTAADTLASAINGTSSTLVSATVAKTMTISAPSTVTAGSPFSLVVTVYDQFGNVDTGYTGTVYFTKTDSGAGSAVPANYTFTTGVGGDDGTHFFTNGATLVTAGAQTITAADLVNSAIAATTNSINVTAAAAKNFTVSAPPTRRRERASMSRSRRSTSTATSPPVIAAPCRSPGALGPIVPANYTFAATDNGVHTFVAGVTLDAVGAQTVSATDTVNSAITGTSNSITVSPAAATHFGVSAPASATAGSTFAVTVTALDQFGNVATSYLGTVVASKSDSGADAAVPANYTFTANDKGVHTFSTGFDLVTVGTQTIGLTDSAVPGITGSTTLSVTAAAANHFTVSAPATLSPARPSASRSRRSTSTATRRPATPARSSSRPRTPARRPCPPIKPSIRRTPASSPFPMPSSWPPGEPDDHRHRYGHRHDVRRQQQHHGDRGGGDRISPLPLRRTPLRGARSASP